MKVFVLFALSLFVSDVFSSEVEIGSTGNFIIIEESVYANMPIRFKPKLVSLVCNVEVAFLNSSGQFTVFKTLEISPGLTTLSECEALVKLLPVGLK